MNGELRHTGNEARDNGYTTFCEETPGRATHRTSLRMGRKALKKGGAISVSMNPGQMTTEGTGAMRRLNAGCNRFKGNRDR